MGKKRISDMTLSLSHASHAYKLTESALGVYCLADEMTGSVRRQVFTRVILINAGSVERMGHHPSKTPVAIKRRPRNQMWGSSDICSEFLSTSNPFIELA